MMLAVYLVVFLSVVGCKGVENSEDALIFAQVVSDLNIKFKNYFIWKSAEKNPTFL